jgi:hypothetical protein
MAFLTVNKNNNSNKNNLRQSPKANTNKNTRTNTSTNTDKDTIIDTSNNEELETLEIISEIIYNLKSKYGETRITKKSIHHILKETIELVDKIKCNGPQKKKHVITIMKTLINDLVDDENEKELFISIIENDILENMIDLIIDASRGKININKRRTQKKIINLTTGILDTLFHLISCLTKR